MRRRVDRRFVICELAEMEHPLRTYRRQRDITLEQLALETGLSKSHLSEIEGGKLPGSKTIATLYQKTGLIPGVFFAPSPRADLAIPSSSSSVAGEEGTTNDGSGVAHVCAKITHDDR